ncbi:MAG: ribonuclease BN, partial [Acidimicrobiales bacterium]
MAWTTGDRMMDLRAKHPAIEVGVDTLDGWRRHISGRNASVLAFFGFLSIFPLMLAATTILGLVLKNNQELQQRIIDGALAD